MKTTTLFRNIMVLAVPFVLYSCSTTEYASHIRKADLVSVERKVEKSANSTAAMRSPKQAMQPMEVISNMQVAAEQENFPGILSGSEVKNAEQSRTEEVSFSKREDAFQLSSRLDKREVKKFLKQVKKEYRTAHSVSASDRQLLEIILAIFIPPIAVYLHDGVGTSLLINIILCLLFWIPGIVHALLVVFDVV